MPNIAKLYFLISALASYGAAVYFLKEPFHYRRAAGMLALAIGALLLGYLRTRNRLGE